MALDNGAVYAGYTVVRRLRADATGESYLVSEPGFPGWQVLEILPQSWSSDDAFRRRFERDSAIAARLYHPHIVEVRAHGELDGRLWIAMDYIEGIDVGQLMRDRFPAVLPVGEVLEIVAPVADALDYAHQRGLVHGDVKPADIVMTNAGEGQPRILLKGFGIAAPHGAPGDATGFVAPEQLTGAEADGRSDQYALAATAMILLTGAAPGSGSPSAAPKLSDLRPDLARLDALFARALATEPAGRFRTCHELADALRDEVGGSFGAAGRDDMEVGASWDLSPDAGATGASQDREVLDYPAYGWPAVAPPQPPVHPGPMPMAPQPPATLLQAVAASLARRLNEFSAAGREPRKRRLRRILIGSVVAILLVGMLAVAIPSLREITSSPPPAAAPATSSPPAPSTSATSPQAATPEPLDGTYSIEIQRAKQLYNGRPSPQPPNVTTWWAIQSSCIPTGCLAAAAMLDGYGHGQAKQGIPPIIMEFSEGQWRSRPDTVRFACIGPNGEANTQTTVQVLTLRPQSTGDLVGALVVTVETNECGQQSAVIRIPAVASRSGDIPPGIKVPNPVTIPKAPQTPATSESPSETPTVTPTTPTTAPSGPGR
ncbi:Serine/threonine-protein kinase PknI [Mycobacterium marinum]|uniref:serine/threonine-protein kinase n=1 Tax=Mycobacterium marinum TaxID=1781 RepID=UPI000E3BCF2C|nr:serine/threonine-protein kinase [Mycobacterium marinum]RFZ63319.1 Serine/threonine-protein kinase PknI [Mycobacterium marinum]